MAEILLINKTFFETHAGLDSSGDILKEGNK
jgi:hypothetical protein